MKKTQNDPFNPRPKGLPVNGSIKQLALLDALQPPNYEVLPTSYLLKLFGFHTGRDLITLLNGEGYIRIPRAKEARQMGARNRKATWELTERGMLLLASHQRFNKLPFGDDQFAHKYLRSIIQFSFDQAAKEVPGLTKRTMIDILAHADCPKTLKDEAAKGHNLSWIPLKTFIKPDAPLFGYVYLKPDGKKRTFYLHGFEADRGTEPLTGYDRQTIQAKLKNYAEYLEKGQYFKRYGIPNCAVAFVCVSPARAKNILDLIAAGYPKLAHKFLVKVTTPFEADAPAPPDGHMVTEDWLLANSKTFNILKFLKGETHGHDAESRTDSRAA
jgi:Replication-relaxation